MPDRIKPRQSEKCLIELPHSAYSPDLLQCEFWRFNPVKKHLAGKFFNTRLSLGYYLHKVLKAILQEEIKSIFLK